MSVKSIKPARRLRGEITIPGDKSISHRAVMFGSLARGTTEITHFLNGADCLATIDCFRQMGISIEQKRDLVLVHGNGIRGLTAPSAQLYTGIAAQPHDFSQEFYPVSPLLLSCQEMNH